MKMTRKFLVPFMLMGALLGGAVGVREASAQTVDEPAIAAQSPSDGEGSDEGGEVSGKDCVNLGTAPFCGAPDHCPADHPIQKAKGGFPFGAICITGHKLICCN